MILYRVGDWNLEAPQTETVSVKELLLWLRSDQDGYTTRLLVARWDWLIPSNIMGRNIGGPDQT